MVSFKVLYITLIGLFLTGCQNTLSSFIPTSVDVKLGDLILDQTLADNKGKIIDTLHLDPLQTSCKSVFKHLTNSNWVSKKQDFAWSIHFIKDDSIINAFCLPGGHLFVYSGLLNLCTSKDEIAGVIAHEIAHANNRHSINQIVQQLGLQIIFESILGINSTLLGIGTQLLQLKFSRTDELEADEFAFNLLNENGYKTEALISFFNKMKLSNQVQVIEFMSTHPETENRIQAIKKLKLKNSN